MLLVALLVTACQQRPAREVELQRLEEGIVAPCCWRETLATHDSGPARELRAQVGARIERGERPEAILADLELTYGHRIRAAPDGWSWTAFGAWLLVVPLLGGLALLVRLARRTGAGADDLDRGAARATDPPPADLDLERALADRLDDELDALD